MHCQYLVINSFKFIYNVNQMRVLSIITLPKDWLHVKQILTFSKFLIITKQSHACMPTFQKQELGLQRLWKEQLRMHLITVCQNMKKWKLLLRSTLQRGNVHFKKLFPKVMFLNDTSPECWHRLFHKKEELENYLMIVLIYFKWIC